MTRIKSLISFVDTFFLSFWGFNIMDMLSISSSEPTSLLSNVDSSIRVLLSLAGLIWFCISIPHKISVQKQERISKKLENDLKREDLERKMRENDLKDS